MTKKIHFLNFPTIIVTETNTQSSLILMGNIFAPQGCVIKSVDLSNGVVIYVPIQRYIEHFKYMGHCLRNPRVIC